MALSFLLVPIAWWMGITPFGDLIKPPYVVIASIALLLCFRIDSILNRLLIRKIDDAPDEGELDSYMTLRIKSDEALSRAKEADRQKEREERAKAEKKRKLEKRAKAELAEAKRTQERKKREEEERAKAQERRRRRQLELEAHAEAEKQRLAEMEKAEMEKTEDKMRQKERQAEVERVKPVISTSATKPSSIRTAPSVNPKKINRRNASICPKCGSCNTVLMGSTKKVSVSRAVVGGALLGPIGAGVGAMTGKKQRHEFLCRSCGARWRV